MSNDSKEFLGWLAATLLIVAVIPLVYAAFAVGSVWPAVLIADVIGICYAIRVALLAADETEPPMREQPHYPAEKIGWWGATKITLWALGLFLGICVAPFAGIAAIAGLVYGIVWLAQNYPSTLLFGLVVIGVFIMCWAVIWADGWAAKRETQQRIQNAYPLPPLVQNHRVVYPHDNRPLPPIQPKPKRNWSWFQPKPKHFDEQHDAAQDLLRGIAEIQHPGDTDG